MRNQNRAFSMVHLLLIFFASPPAVRSILLSIAVAVAIAIHPSRDLYPITPNAIAVNINK